MLCHGCATLVKIDMGFSRSSCKLLDLPTRNTALSIRPVSQTERADNLDLELAAQLGALAPHATAAALDKILALNPDDLLNRARLLGYYWKYYKATSSGKLNLQQRDSRTSHILWFIENAPDCVFASDYYMTFDAQTDCENLDLARKAWEGRLATYPHCVQSKINYALCVFDVDPKIAIELLQQVLKIEKYNEWALTLLPLLGMKLEIELPIEKEVAQTTSKVNVSKGTERLLSMCLSRSGLSKITVLTQEALLEQYEFDLWPRLEIITWCSRNLRRANRLGFDPSVLQRSYQHLRWILKHAPDLSIAKDFLYTDFPSDMPLPKSYFQKLDEAIQEALGKPINRSNVFMNWMLFYVTNVGAQKTKEMFFATAAWKELDRKIRQTLLRELNRNYRSKTIFEKSFDLNDVALSKNVELSSPTHVINQLEVLADQLHLAHSYYEGMYYSADEATHLQHILKDFGSDLVSTARLCGCYAKFVETLAPDLSKRYSELLRWIIDHIPESDLASKSFRTPLEHSHAVNSAWKQAISKNPKTARILINAANSLSECSTESAKSILNTLLVSEPNNAEAKALLQQLSFRREHGVRSLDFYDTEFANECQIRISDFSNSAENELLTSIFDQIGVFLYPILECLTIPQITLWSNEQVLLINPNDPILRLEVLGWCDRHQLDRMISTLSNPEIARRRTRHILWLFENTPNADLYFYTRHNNYGIPNHEKIISSAVKTQRKRYGKTVAKYRPEFPRKKKSGD